MHTHCQVPPSPDADTPNADKNDDTITKRSHFAHFHVLSSGPRTTVMRTSPAASAHVSMITCPALPASFMLAGASGPFRLRACFDSNRRSIRNQDASILDRHSADGVSCHPLITMVLQTPSQRDIPIPPLVVHYFVSLRCSFGGEGTHLRLQRCVCCTWRPEFLLPKQPSGLAAPSRFEACRKVTHVTNSVEGPKKRALHDTISSKGRRGDIR